jgi:hypothetical protein
MKSIQKKKREGLIHSDDFTVRLFPEKRSSRAKVLVPLMEGLKRVPAFLQVILG